MTTHVISALNDVALEPVITATATAPKPGRKSRKADATAPKSGRTSRRADAIHAATLADASIKADAAEAARQDAAFNQEAEIVTASWIRAIKASSHVSAIVAARASDVFHAFQSLSLVASPADARKGSNLKSSLLLCKPSTLAALPASAAKSLVKSVLATWEHHATRAAHPTDESAQSEGKAICKAMSDSFYGASYRFNESAILNARKADKERTKEANKAKEATLKATQAALENARAILTSGDVDAIAQTPACMIVETFNALKFSISASSPSAADALSLADIMLESAFQLRKHYADAVKAESEAYAAQ